ncbi:NAD-dependent epimerase/dehydratase family protein [Hymenobacter sp.]|jgi:dihydroflavonol-4-reductase|uniref:NAD-dependent epimerase/dehydratase family protein n=1 Tax=Hymenobacter sp. TaxID=1898978 RepID=UPI002ED7D670
MKVLITGATGFVGAAIVQELLVVGHEVVGLVRSLDKAAALIRQGMVPHVGEMKEPATYVPLVPTVDAVIQAAQLSVAGRFTHKSKNHINQADEAMTLALAEACLQGQKRLIYTSGCFNYGDHGAAWIEEQTPATPSPLGEGHARVVARLLALHQTQGLDVVILSPGFVYGPSGLFKTSFYDTLRNGQLRVFGKGQNYWSPIQVNDLARAFALALERGQAGQVYNIVDDAPVPLRELIDSLTAAQGVKPVGSIPPWLIGLLIGAPLVDSLTSSFRVRNDKAKQALGWQPQYPTFAEGIKPVLQVLNAR